MSQTWDAAALRGVRIGSCILEEPLGVGGMGAVYLARQERPHRQVAVKILRPQLASNAEALRVFLARFRREADATAVLDHANIVPIYEFGEDGGMAYLVMPYLKDGSLATLLAREGTLALQRAISFVDQAAAALDHAHRHQIVHRDVKPSNLLLHPDGRVLLADFGIARPIDRPQNAEDELVEADLSLFAADGTLTQTGAAMGTPEYMAPEQVQGAPVGPAADTYALGTVTYVMLTGHTPFGGGEVSAVLTRQLIDPPRPLRTARPDVPASVEEVIFWALAKDPADRPATAGQFASALREARRERTLGRLFGWAAAAQEASDVFPHPADVSESTAIVSTRMPDRTRPLPSSAGTPALSESGLLMGRTSSHPTVADPPPYLIDTPTEATLLVDRPVRNAPEWPGASAPPPKRRARRWLGAAAVFCALAVTLAVGIGFGSLASQVGSGVLGSANVAATRTASALPSPTAAPSPTATPVAPANWLSASPDSITLGCHGDKRSQVVTLTNAGPRSLGWKAAVPTFAGQSEVAVTPGSGTLHAGQSTYVTITNRATFIPYHGTVEFRPASDTAGVAAVVEFSASACG